MNKQIAVGAENFQDLIEKNGYYVDKTPFIKTVFGDNACSVQLITRPRRFGKTLMLSTFEHFLKINPADPEDLSLQKKLFSGTWILRRDENDPENESRALFCKKFMGRFPVISLSLKNIEGATFAEAYARFAETVFALAKKYTFLKESPKLEDFDKKNYSRLLDIRAMYSQTERRNLVISSLYNFCDWLHGHFGIKPIVLIDEYDVPLAKAYARGYYDEMLNFLRTFLGLALKTNDHLYKAVLTGCLRVSKESIFTGINNFAVNSVLNTDKNYASGIGFTKDETCRMLEYFNLDKYSRQVHDHYDGYNFGGVALVCPWDVVNFCADFSSCNDHKKILTDLPNYWINSSGNDIIEEFLSYRDQQFNDDMQNLIAGKTIRIQLNETLSYDDLGNHQSDDFWTLMLYTGYLTFANKNSRLERNVCNVRIPNLEVRETFKDIILNFYKNAPVMVRLNSQIVDAALQGNAKLLKEKLTDFLQSYISVRDFATKAPAENYYHGMLNGILAGDPKLSEYKSNFESDNGYPDIVFLSQDNRTAVIIELKKADSFSEIDSKTSLALKQIEEDGYAQPYIKIGFVTEVFAYGICFYKKICEVMCKKLK